MNGDIGEKFGQIPWNFVHIQAEFLEFGTHRDGLFGIPYTLTDAKSYVYNAM